CQRCRHHWSWRCLRRSAGCSAGEWLRSSRCDHRRSEVREPNRSNPRSCGELSEVFDRSGGEGVMRTFQRANRKDRARRAGCSTAVVSYVINNGPREVSSAMKERVLRAMKELDYRPNAIARSLSRSATDTVAMLVPNVNNGYFAELISAVEEAAQAHN